jgi:uncharacterized membrane protein YccC
MKADAEAVLFSVKCFVAAMLAYYVALQIGLTRPFWAVTTSYIVAQPLAGAVLSKAAFRMIGTLLGAAAAVVLVPTFVNEPAVLSMALALWLGACLYVSLLDRTPRAYIFLLAGYTASIIGFPSVDTPGAIFDVASLRVQEITIGILAGSLVHGLVLPRSVTARLLQRIEKILNDAEGWSRAALSGVREETLDRERRRLAIDLTELHQLSIHLPFDTARLLPRVRTVRAMEDQLSLLLPLASTVEDRLVALTSCEGGVPAPIRDFVERVRDWLADGARGPDRGEQAERLIEEARALEPPPGGPEPIWRDMLLLNLLARVADLIAAHRDCRDLQEQIRSPSPRALSPRVGELLAQAGGRALHRDRGLAVRAALGTIATIALACTFWIGTAWPDGAGAVLIAGVCCALFGNVDDPGPVIFTFFIGSAIGLGVAMIWAYAILPRTTDFVTLAAVLAPPLLLMGSMLARPPLTLVSLGMLLAFPNTVGLNATYKDGFAAFANGALAQLVGTGFAVVTVGLFQTIGTEHSVARLIRAGWRDVARRARGRAPATARWTSGMLDRIGLLLPRLAKQAPDPGKPLLDALVDLRIGFVAGELDRLGHSSTPEERGLIADTLAGIWRHFIHLDPVRTMPPPEGLLTEIDRTVAAFAADPQAERRRQGLVLLTSLRRNLFPAAPAYRGSPA